MVTNYNYAAIPPQGDPMAEAIIPGIQQGMKLAYLPKQLDADLKAKQLTEALNQVKLKYAEPTAQANLSSMLSKSNQPLSSFGKLQSDYQNAVNNFGGNSPQAQQLAQALQTASQGRNGVSVSFDPVSGKPVINVGGTAGRGGNMGGTFVNPETGEITSRPTTAQASRLQRGVTGGENLESFVNKYMETLPKFQNPKVKALNWLEKFSNAALGTDYSLPSEEAYGTGSLKTASEGLLNDLQLNATGENVSQVMDILSPKFGEGEGGFKNRASKQLKDFLEMQLRLKNQLRSGYNVGQAKNVPAPVDQINAEQANHLATFLGSTGANITNYGNPLNAAQAILTQAPQDDGKTYTYNGKTITDEDIAYTAKKRGMTVDEVKKKMGVG